MSVFEELKREVMLQHDRGSFPEWLLPEILKIVENPNRFACSEQLVQTLLNQIRDFDPYAGGGLLFRFLQPRRHPPHHSPSRLLIRNQT